jgi:hypothetical protein
MVYLKMLSLAWTEKRQVLGRLMNNNGKGYGRK